MSDRIDVKAKHIFRDKNVHFIVTKFSIYQDDTALSLYISNNVVGCKRIHVLEFHADKVQKHAQPIVMSEAFCYSRGGNLPTQQGNCSVDSRGFESEMAVTPY